jgi:hypothetical protein
MLLITFITTATTMVVQAQFIYHLQGKMPGRIKEYTHIHDTCFQDHIEKGISILLDRD